MESQLGSPPIPSRDRRLPYPATAPPVCPRRTERSRLPAPVTGPIYDTAGSNIYDRPLAANAMAPSDRSDSSQSSADGRADRALLSKDGSGQAADARACEKLEKSTRRIKTAVSVLLVLCVLVMVVYVCVIVALIVVLSQTEAERSSPTTTARDHGARSHGQGGEGEAPPASVLDGSGGKKYCVDENEINEFKNIWDPEDQKDVKDMLEDIGFIFYSKDKRYCFSSLQWVPKIMGKINSRVQESVSYIEDQQTKINETVNLYTSANNTKSLCSANGPAVKVTKSPTDPLYSVYAHYFMDTDATYPSEVGDVKWIMDGQKQSSRNRVDVSSETGRFIIRDSGFYFIYTHLVFREGSSGKMHRVMKTRSGQRTKLLESTQGSASFLQGVFRLRANDSLTVEATTQTLDTSRDRVSYFGVYLIRT